MSGVRGTFVFAYYPRPRLSECTLLPVQKTGGTKNRLAVFFFSEELRVVCTYLIVMRCENRRLSETFAFVYKGR